MEQTLYHFRTGGVKFYFFITLIFSVLIFWHAHRVNNMNKMKLNFSLLLRKDRFSTPGLLLILTWTTAIFNGAGATYEKMVGSLLRHAFIY
jgi:hypothetical protein